MDMVLPADSLSVERRTPLASAVFQRTPSQLMHDAVPCAPTTDDHADRTVASGLIHHWDAGSQ
jgi:hypothetical protein